MYFLGIDLGTSAVKVLVINDKDQIVGEASKEYPVYYPRDKYAEQNPLDWYNKTVDAIKEVIKTCNIPKNGIKSIGFSGQMHGLVALDKDNNVLHPCILWCDNRTEKECEEITNFFGKEKLREYTGNRALTGFTGPKVLWIKKNKPEIFEKIAHILLPKDYLRLKFTDDYAMDVSDAAGTLMLDVKNRIWSKPMLNYLGINDTVMPSLCESYEVTGKLNAQTKEVLGIEGEVLVVGGAGDNAAGAVGAGVTQEGQILMTLGTSGVVFAPSTAYAVDEDCTMHVFCDATGKYHAMGVILSAASCMKWWSSINQMSEKDLVKEAEEAKTASSHLIFLPHLMGERFDANVKGCFLGLTATTTRAEMTRAVLEGVVYFLNDSLEMLKEVGVKVDEIRVIGGGAKSELWKQIIADVTNTNVLEINTNQGGALGACILAGVGYKHFQSPDKGAETMVKVMNTIEPIQENVSVYKKAYGLYKKAYPELKDYFKIMSEM